MDIMDYLKKQIRKDIKKIVFPEGENLSVIKAAVYLKQNALVDPILIGNKNEISRILRGELELAGDITTINPMEDSRLEYYIKTYCEERMMPDAVGRKIISQPIYFAAMMVKAGEAHGMVGGIDYPTEEVIMASELILGLQKDISVPSSFYLLDVPGFNGEKGRRMIFADPSINPDPTSRELADIAYTTAQSVSKILGWEPRVALLSFSTKGSANHPCVDKVKEAFQILEQRECPFIFDGELQADAAMNKVIGYKKTKGESKVAGNANVLIFPNLDAANISSKLVQQLTGAKFYGPILQGFNFPVSDLSRGATVEDIIGTTLLTAAR
ncbi:phosphate acyltransferase [Geosporobacter ferrireducens]|uniref:phosphate acyltransferase n=1 Tax=Geosporobacter ferrireducens TaxID=1424294 RepID=UPI00139B2F72|nr:phosphate acyltransferase [Geosporobacter ferrireducens]MTI54739.1 phosphate acetyltransferase [Geosporobacter ferrireducens]